jgi:threonine dehydrogenase-like Zn-dependent dehydrogenase
LRKTEGTYLVNHADRPLRFGEVNLINPPRRERRGRLLLEGVLCQTVCTGFCGTDWELMQMGARGELDAKFPSGQQRLINGHEGVVWVPEEQRCAIVLIRGGDAWDPSRFEADESYFEYGCDGADGLMSHYGYYNPEMLLQIPEDHLPQGKPLSRELASRLIFADPMACMLFQVERIEDLLMGHNWRLYAARGMNRAAAMESAVTDGFARVVIYGLGGTGILGAIAIREAHPDARIVTVGRSDPDNPKAQFLARHWRGIEYVQTRESPQETAAAIEEALGGKPRVFIGASGSAVEAEIALGHGLLDNNGIYASFSLGPRVCYDTMPFGFRNQLIFGAINFRRDQMEAAIELLCRHPLDELVGERQLEELQRDPMGFYEEVYRSPERPLKTMVVWEQGCVE